MTKDYQIAIPTELGRKLKSELAARRIRKGEADKHAVLVREIMKHKFRNDLYKNWVNLSSHKIAMLIGKRTYARQLRRLQESGVLYRTDSYYAGNAPRLFPDIEPFPKAVALARCFGSHRDCSFWGLTSKQSIKAVEAGFKLEPRTETAKLLANFLPEFHIKIDEEDFCLKQYRTAWSLENTSSINDGRFFMTEDSFSGRIHTNFTQLQAEARRRIFCDRLNTFCVGMDISAMQPLLIGHAARSLSEPQPIHIPGAASQTLSMCPHFFSVTNCYAALDDVEQWIADCEMQKIYEKVRLSIPADRLRFTYRVWATGEQIPIDISKMDRKAFKRQMLQVIFDRNEQAVGNPIWDTINETYPKVAQFIWDLKTDDYKNAAKVSQNWEVKIMIHQIAAEHIRRGIPIITVHDEIVTPLPDETRQIIRDAFAKLDLFPTIH